MDAQPSFTGDGHTYSLSHFEGNGSETLKFICKVTNADGDLETVHDGTTNEVVIAVLIHRLQTLNAKMPSKYNENAIDYLRAALNELQMRTNDRVDREVEGTNQE